ncbi:hypothetical protein [Capnocytophaga sputigena]|jgi:hypothetical protein|uniref:hypothetical protein n=1 Tax=Capnocytophaga sputigena TaxID=1019 RepID=UPI0028E41144|nr:hypothetical protein [Capnocytophaga sputigena]
MNLPNFMAYCSMFYQSTGSGISKNGIALGDVVIDKDNNIGIVIHIRAWEDRVRLDLEENCIVGDKTVRLATDEEIAKYRPNILKENFNEEKMKKYEVVSIEQERGDGQGRIKITAPKHAMEAAIRYVTHWWKNGDTIERLNALGTDERDKYIKAMSIYFNNIKTPRPCEKVEIINN